MTILTPLEMSDSDSSDDEHMAALRACAVDGGGIIASFQAGPPKGASFRKPQPFEPKSQHTNANSLDRSRGAGTAGRDAEDDEDEGVFKQVREQEMPSPPFLSPLPLASPHPHFLIPHTQTPYSGHCGHTHCSHVRPETGPGCRAPLRVWEQ
jgi:hypothetical protein